MFSSCFGSGLELAGVLETEVELWAEFLTIEDNQSLRDLSRSEICGFDEYGFEGDFSGLFDFLLL